MKNIVEIEHLKKYFKETKAVDDISFCIKEGELFALLGLNGAGKSTTINVLVGILQKDDGKVVLDGMSVENNIGETSKKVGIVFQNSVLDKKLTVYENLKYRAGMYGISKEDFEKNLNELATKLEFNDILKRPFEKLSGGQKRRVDIARALIHKPKLLILDEPTTGLDPKTRILVWKLISELRQTKNLTVLLTTHYMEEASDANWVVIMDGGKIVAEGSPIDLKNKYAFDYVRIYAYDEKLEQILQKSPYKWQKTDKFIEIEFENTNIAKQFVVENEKIIFDLEIIKGNMDSVFLNVTGKNLKEAVWEMNLKNWIA